MKKDKQLLIIKSQSTLSAEVRNSLEDSLNVVADTLGFQSIVLDGGMDAEILPAAGSLERILEAMLRQTEAIQCLADGTAALIQALAEGEDEDEERAPQTYLDGSPCR